MNLKSFVGYGIILTCCLMATGCFSIEQEIFLNADGSGQLVVFISLPDLPEKMGGAEITSKKTPADALGEFKKELTTSLPPTVTLKLAKEVKQNGVQSIYAVFAFKQLQDIQRVLANWFDSDKPLRSGWAWGQKYLQDGVAVAEAKVGKGKLFLFGPEIAFRGQPHGTFKFLFNGIYYGGAESVTLR